MVRHGHDQPASCHLQQPDPRRAARAAIRRLSRSRILPVLCQQWTSDLGSGSAPVRFLLAITMLIAALSPALAASEADFKAAYAAAEAAEKDAGSLRNQWLTAEATLAAAKKAADGGDFEAAT